MPSTTNPEEEEVVDVPENDGNASMPEQVKRPNPWKKKKKKKMMMMKNALYKTSSCFMWDPTVLKYFCFAVKLYMVNGG
jgi:hypothetical protein